MKKKAIIFDLDGTLLDTREDIANAVNYCLKANNLEELDIEDILEKTGRGNRKLIRDCAPDIDDKEFEKLYKDFRIYYSQHCTDKTTIYPNMVETLAILKQKGYKMAVVSNKIDSITKKMVEHFFPNTFDYILGGVDGIKLKPAPDMIYVATFNLKFPIIDTVYIGDSLIDYETSVNTKMSSIIVSYGYANRFDLEIRGCPIIIDDAKDILNYL